jgi:hypothetical protein
VSGPNPRGSIRAQNLDRTTAGREQKLDRWFHMLRQSLDRGTPGVVSADLPTAFALLTLAALRGRPCTCLNIQL